MSTPPAGISEADWLATPSAVRSLIPAQLRERICRGSRNSSKPPSSDGPGFKPPGRRRGSGRKRGGQPGHPGSGPELLPIERVDEVVEHHPDACRRCATLPPDGEASHYGPRLSALVGLLGSAFPLSFNKTQALLD